MRALAGVSHVRRPAPIAQGRVESTCDDPDDCLLGELVAEHTATARGLQEELEHEASRFRAVHGTSGRLGKS